MRKINPYLLFSATSFVVAIFLASVFDFSLSNTWQGLVTTFFVFGPCWLLGLKKAIAHKDTHPLLCGFALFCLGLFFIGSIVAVIAIVAMKK